MRAASARAISSHRNAAIATRDSSGPSPGRGSGAAEFPFCLANHLPMVLVALHRMGASDERLEAYCHIYREQNGLVPIPRPIGEITRDNWREFLGQREREGDYRDVLRRRSRAARRDAGRPALSAATHARHRGERHARVHAHGLCDDDATATRKPASRSPIGPRPIFRSARSRGANALDRRSGRGSRVHAWAGGVPPCRAGARSSVALHARGGSRSRNSRRSSTCCAIGPETHDRDRRLLARALRRRRSTSAHCMR